jgi:hypothetical protein
LKDSTDFRVALLINIASWVVQSMIGWAAYGSNYSAQSAIAWIVVYLNSRETVSPWLVTWLLKHRYTKLFQYNNYKNDQLANIFAIK